MWVFVNNLLFDIKLSFLVLLLLVILFLNFSLYCKKYIKLFIFIILWFSVWIAISTYNISKLENTEKILTNYLNNTKHKIEFSIKNLEKYDDSHKIYVWELISIDGNKISQKVDFLVYFPLNYSLKSWDILVTNQKLYWFKDLWNFAYKKYMLSKNIYFKVYVNYFDRIWYEKPNNIIFEVNKIRKQLIDTIHKLYPEKEAIFLAWILLWAREDLPQELKTNFNNSWLTHFIAVSGFNITILIVFFSLFLKYFPIWVRNIAITFFVVLFVLLVGFSIPVIRAAIMWLLAYYILMSGRKWNLLTIVLITAFLLILYLPLSLNYDISLHLSFLAVLWIIYCQWFFNKLFSFLPETLAIREAFVMTLSALVFSIPIMIFDFGQLSILSVFANLSVTWTIPIAMLLWFLSIIVYYVYNPLWWIISFLAWIFLKWDMLMVEYFGTRDWALLKFDNLEYWNYLKLLYFIILIFLITYFKE